MTDAARRAQPESPVGRVVVREATGADEPDLRALLRARPMDGMIRVALTREPDASIAAAVEGERHVTFVVRDEERLLGMGSRSVRRVYLRSKPALIGYLGQLRVTDRACGIKRLRAGYAQLRAARRSDELPFDLTAIVSDNLPARRLLERGLPGLPRYRPVGEIETLIVPTARRRFVSGVAQVRPAASLDEALTFLDAQLRGQPFAPVWTREAFTSGRLRGLALEDLRVLEEDGRVVAMGAIWDQRAYKQAVVDGYAGWLTLARPAVNLGLAALGQPTLPPPGSVLPLAYLSAFAVLGDEPARAYALVEALRREARARGIGQLVLSLAVEHRLCAALRGRFSARPYRSMVYVVHWPDVALPGDLRGDLLGGGLPCIEAALL